MEPIFREIKESDIEDLVTIMDDEWEYHTFGPGWEILIELYVRRLIEESDYRVAVEKDGKLIGTLMATTDYRCEELAKPDEVESAMRASNGRSGVKEFNMIMSIDSDLISEIDHEGVGKITLLILSKDSKGLHLGGKLVRDALDHLRSKGKRGVILVTDTYCNMGFYDHMGFEMGGTRHVVSDFGYTMERAVYSMKF